MKKHKYKKSSSLRDNLKIFLFLIMPIYICLTWYLNYIFRIFICGQLLVTQASLFVYNIRTLRAITKYITAYVITK
jgi:hypothetical protein